MSVRAFAKINLGLKILRKRPDGFHELDTIFARIGLFDELEFRARSDSKIILKTENAKIPRGQNLVFRAAEILQKLVLDSDRGSPKKACPRPGSGIGVDIFLRKKIPVGAGLGGGSADAAAVLRVLPKIWGVQIPAQKLHKIAVELGSDVPFFLEKKVCRARGRGEILKKINLPKKFPREVLLVIPPVAISTEWAFSQIKNEKLKMKKNSQLENDFEKLIFREFPEIGKIKSVLEKNGAEFASLSGSGSAIFGLFEKRPTRALAQKFEKFGQVFVAKIRE